MRCNLYKKEAIYAPVQVTPVACLSDNYAYLVENGTGGAAVVDPSEAGPVEAALRERNLTLEAIWLTHHHWDHVGGVEQLVATRRPRDVLGAAYDHDHERIPGQTRALREGDALEFGGKPVTLIDIPGHTLGAIGYLIGGHLFSGDTLFLSGCGRVFEGTMGMMQRSLAKLRELPPDTLVCCGHEYTAANLRFAKAVEPDNPAIDGRTEATRAARDADRPTVPGRLADELEANPFLRWDAPAVIAYAREHGAEDDTPASVFGAIRRAKDGFR